MKIIYVHRSLFFLHFCNQEAVKYSKEQIFIFFSQEAVEYSKSFVTSVIIGKDVVPRIGLHQLEALRHDLVYAIHKSSDPKVCISHTINGVKLMEFHMLLHTRYRDENICWQNVRAKI